MILATSYFLPGIQANGVAAAVENAWGVNVTWATEGDRRGNTGNVADADATGEGNH